MKWFYCEVVESTKTQLPQHEGLQEKQVWGQIGLWRIMKNDFLLVVLSLPSYQGRIVSVMGKHTSWDPGVFLPKGHHSISWGEDGCKLKGLHLLLLASFEGKKWQKFLHHQGISIIISFFKTLKKALWTTLATFPCRF